MGMRKKLLLICFTLLIAISISHADSIPDGQLPPELTAHASMVLLIDPEDGAIIDANEAAIAFYGYSIDQLRQMQIQQLNVFELQDVVVEYSLARDEERNYFIFPHRLANGEVRTVEVYSSPFTTPSDRTLLLSIIHDATDKVLLEEELQHYKTRLEHLVAARTQEIVNANNRIKWLTILGTCLVFGLGLFLFQKHQRALFFRRQYELENERKSLLERFEYLTQYANDIILLVDARGHIVEANEKAVMTYGFSREELLQKNIREIRDSKRNIPYEVIQERAIKEDGHIYEALHIRKNGTRFLAEASVGYFKIDRQSFFQHILRDITERKQIEEKLLESEEKYRCLVEQSADMMYLHDLKGCFLDVNHAAMSHTGYSREELLGMSVFDIHSDRSRHDEILRKWKEWQPGQTEIIETIHLRKDGSKFIAEVKAGKVHFGGEHYILSLVRDITERKRAENALRESEEKFRIVFEQSAIGMGRVNLTSAHWVDVNEAFCNMLGYTPEEMRATPWPDITHPDDIDLDLIPFRQMAAGNLENYTIEKRFIHKQGHPVWACLTLSLVRDIHGRPDYEIAIIENITQRKMAEAALQALTDTLEQQVAKRTELAEARSRQLQELTIELVEAEERERRRIAGLLHDDLQQLLASAWIQVQATRERHPSIDSLKNVESTLKESIEKSRNLSHELTPPVLQQGDLADTIEWLAHRMKKQFGLQVKVERTALPRFKNAPLKVFIFKTVQELLFNIVKHSGVEDARVIFSGNEDSFSITVTDQGRGFDPDILSSHGTAGLGLSNLAQRANSVGCNLDIESAPGQGSRIMLTVPVSLVEND